MFCIYYKVIQKLILHYITVFMKFKTNLIWSKKYLDKYTFRNKTFIKFVMIKPLDYKIFIKKFIQILLFKRF